MRGWATFSAPDICMYPHAAVAMLHSHGKAIQHIRISGWQARQPIQANGETLQMPCKFEQCTQLQLVCSFKIGLNPLWGDITSPPLWLSIASEHESLFTGVAGLDAWLNLASVCRTKTAKPITTTSIFLKVEAHPKAKIYKSTGIHILRLTYPAL